MKLIPLKKDNLKQTLSISIEKSDIDKISTEILLDIKSKSNIKGFRAGKAPISFLLKQYEDKIVESIVDGCINLIQNEYEKYINDQKIYRVAFSKVTFKNVEGNDVNFELNFECIPKIDFGKLSDISVTRPKITIEKKHIDDFLQYAVENAKKYNLNEDKDCKIKSSDLVVVSLIAKTESSPIIKDTKIEVYPDKIESEIISKLIDKKVGDEFNIEKTEECKHIFENDFDKVKSINLKVNEVHNLEKMEVNDELAKFYQLENLEALENIGRTKISKEHSALARSYLQKSLLDFLDKKIQSELPGVLIEQEIKQIKSQISEEDKLSDDEIKKIAECRVKLGLTVSDIGTAHNIKVTDEDIANVIKTSEANFGITGKQLEEIIRKNSSFRQQIIASIIENKVMDFLFNQINISEKPMSLEDVKKYLNQ